MASSPALISDSPKISTNPEEQSPFHASLDSHTDPPQENSSEEYTDSDDDPNPGIAVGGCYVVNLKVTNHVTEKALEGIQAVIDDFNHIHGASYKLVEIQKVVKAVCMGYAFDFYFAAKPADSVDNLLTEFEAVVWLLPPDYKVKIVKCEAKSTKRAIEAALDSPPSKLQRGVLESLQPPSDLHKR